MQALTAYENPTLRNSVLGHGSIQGYMPPNAKALDSNRLQTDKVFASVQNFSERLDIYY